MGFAAMCLAFIAHFYPRVFSFAGAAVGFAVGIAASRALPVRPTTPADDVFTLMLTATLCLVLGVGSSLALRAFVLGRSKQDPQDARFLSAIPRMVHREKKAHASARSNVKVGAGR